ncbi:MAG TPA: hypothetical protein VLT59_04860, partial [Steroidobacteraceae bacterium]|nr:hypothetical protein [Steroidobacteraceae bacterium]
RFLVIVPALETGAAEGSIGDLLRQILDGLGLGTAHLVADAVYGVKALGFVLGDIDRVDRLAILCRSPSASGSDEVALADTLRDTGHALMVLQMEGAESAGSVAALQLDALLAFLDPGSGERSCG